MKIGIFSATIKGISREKLKMQIKELEDEFIEYHPSIEYILSKYDKYSSNFDDEELVFEIKQRLIKNLNLVSNTIIMEPINTKIDFVELEKKAPSFIYILRCEQDKIYVGKTKNVNLRFEQHMNGFGSTFTSKYKPISIIETHVEMNEFDEDNYVKLYMKQYGIDNIRGGSYSNLSLTSSQIEVLNLELNHSDNKCFKCNNTGHYSNSCLIEKNNILKTYLITFTLFEEGKNINEICTIRNFEKITIENHVTELLRNKYYIKFSLIEYSTSIRNLVGEIIKEMGDNINYLKPIRELCISKGYKDITYAHIKYTLALDF